MTTTSGTGAFKAWRLLSLAGSEWWVADIGAAARNAGRDLARLPYSIRVLLENALRHCGRGVVTEQDVLAVLGWDVTAAGAAVAGGTVAGATTGATAERPELAFMPGRVLLQDLTGVPCVVDLAAMRSAVARRGGDPAVVDPSVPVDLVVDHSVQVDYAGTPDACARNMELEMQRNSERYALLRWAQGEFANLRIVPPGAGICHQVNLEYLAEVVRGDGDGAAATAAAAPGGTAASSVAAPPKPAAPGAEMAADAPWAYPDTVIGTDSHTTMVNGLGVLGWGVGGIEAEAVMLGQPYFMLVPEVVGVSLVGTPAPQATATDLALTVTELLRGVGVVSRFVEFFGPGAEALALPDRATVANMAPEYGATCGFFPVDGETVAYLRQTGRSDELCARVETYCRHQGLFREPGSADPEYSRVVELDLAEVRPSLAGPRRPQDRVPLEDMSGRFHQDLPTLSKGRESEASAKVELAGGREVVRDGDVVIAAITSCTNTSNPALMVAAGLLARKAADLGLAPKPWVRTSMAPGSRAVTRYLAEAGLLEPLEALGFATVGYGCATCIGNSGPLPAELEQAIRDEELVVAAVLSGNRNFEARIHAAVRANYLASPALVVAFALAGAVDVDLTTEPLGVRGDGRPVYLGDLWPSADEVAATVAATIRPEMFRQEYETALRGSEAWQAMPVPEGALFKWDEHSTYVREAPFFGAAGDGAPNEVTARGGAARDGGAAAEAPAGGEAARPGDIRAARVLAVLGDSVTTDHISPAGSIGVDTPAGRYLVDQGVAPADFNTYGSRRGNHEVLARGTFANVRLRNLMAGGREGGWTTHHPSDEVMAIFDAAERYKADGAPLVVFAGKEYGTGSSRDWAAKGPALLGVRAVIAESFERIHRGNLVGMGVLPVELPAGTTVESLGLDGTELVDVDGIAAGLVPGATVTVRIRRSGAGAATGGDGATDGAAADDGAAAATAATAAAMTGAAVELTCRARIDSTLDAEYFQHGGVLPRVLGLKLR